MLVRRLYQAAKTSETSEAGADHPFIFAIWVLAESGFLYFVTTLTHFIVWWTPCNIAIRVASQMVRFNRLRLKYNLIRNINRMSRQLPLRLTWC